MPLTIAANLNPLRSHPIISTLGSLRRAQKAAQAKSGSVDSEANLEARKNKPLPVFSVRIHEDLPIPSGAKIWAAIIINLVLSAAFFVLPFKTVSLRHSDGGAGGAGGGGSGRGGYLTEGERTAWSFFTTVAAAAFKLWTTGIVQAMWMHMTTKTAPDAEQATAQARFVQTMLGIGSFRETFTNAHVVPFFALMAVDVGAIVAAIAPRNLFRVINLPSAQSASTSAMAMARQRVQTSIQVYAVALGPGEPWAVIFALPSLICAILVFGVMLKLRKTIANSHRQGEI